MARIIGKGEKLRRIEVELLKKSLSQACWRMTNDQILDLADHLHQLIRDRRGEVPRGDVSGDEVAREDRRFDGLAALDDSTRCGALN